MRVAQRERHAAHIATKRAEAMSAVALLQVGRRIRAGLRDLSSPLLPHTPHRSAQSTVESKRRMESLVKGGGMIVVSAQYGALKTAQKVCFLCILFLFVSIRASDGARGASSRRPTSFGTNTRSWLRWRLRAPAGVTIGVLDRDSRVSERVVRARR